MEGRTSIFKKVNCPQFLFREIPHHKMWIFNQMWSLHPRWIMGLLQRWWLHDFNTLPNVQSIYYKHVDCNKKNESKAIEEVVKSLEITEEIPNTSQNFIKEFFYVCLYIYRRPNLYDRLSINETSFNHSFKWLIMEFVVDSMPDTTLKFSPGE